MFAFVCECVSCLWYLGVQHGFPHVRMVCLLVLHTAGLAGFHRGHLGAVLKGLAKKHFEAWLEQPSNPEKPVREHIANWKLWESNRMSAREKRILMTYVYGDAYEEFCSPRFLHCRQQAFRMTGLCMDVAGKNDFWIECEGAPDFRPEPPGKPFEDAAYANAVWAAAPDFEYADELPGGNDEVECLCV